MSLPAVKAAGASCSAEGAEAEGGGTALVKNATHLKKKEEEEEKQRMSPRERGTPLYETAITTGRRGGLLEFVSPC